MAQQTLAKDGNGVRGGEVTPKNASSGSEGRAATARKILDCCVGRPGESLRDAGGTLVALSEPTMTIFDVLVDAEFESTPRVVDSRELDRYDIDELGFHGIDSTEGGGSVTTFSAEYEGDRYGLRIIVLGGEEAESKQDRGGGR